MNPPLAPGDHVTMRSLAQASGNPFRDAVTILVSVAGVAATVAQTAPGGSEIWWSGITPVSNLRRAS